MSNQQQRSDNTSKYNEDRPKALSFLTLMAVTGTVGILTGGLAAAGAAAILLKRNENRLNHWERAHGNKKCTGVHR
jgi:hypothetical protein